MMENISLDLYKVFYYVATEKNITRAAEKLFISQPAVTQTIKKLEEQLSYTLFYRTRKGMSLTEEGQALLEHIEIPIRSLIQSKEILDEKLKNTTQKLRIASGTTLINTNLIYPLKKLKTENPEVELELTKGKVTHEYLKLLQADLVDLVLLNLPTTDITEDMKLEIIEETQNVFVASNELIPNPKKQYSMEELNSLPLVLQENPANSKKFLDKLALKENCTLKPTYQLSNYSLVLSFVRAGLGVGFVNKKHVEKEIASKDLIILNTTFKIPNRKIGVLILKRKEHNELLNKFIEYLKSVD